MGFPGTLDASVVADHSHAPGTLCRRLSSAPQQRRVSRVAARFHGRGIGERSAI